MELWPAPAFFRWPWGLCRGLHLLRWPDLCPVQVSAPGLWLWPLRRGSKQLLSQWRRVQGEQLSPLPVIMWWCVVPRIVSASPPSLPGVTVTRLLMTLARAAPRVTPVSSASASPRAATVTPMPRTRTASVPLDKSAYIVCLFVISLSVQQDEVLILSSSYLLMQGTLSEGKRTNFELNRKNRRTDKFKHPRIPR